VNDASPVVFVVDDDPSVAAALKRLIRSVGLDVQTFRTAEEFLRVTRPEGPACLVLDVRLPGVSGLDLQQKLGEAGLLLPVVFITGHGDIPMTVRAMKAGAVEFLPKPFREQDLLDAIQRAIRQDRSARQQRAELLALRQRYESLTPREAEVFRLVASGMPNKQVAATLGMSEKTIKVHRGRIMHKMQAQSLPDLVRMAGKLESTPSPS
jgi:RNA polymerase sigma factor (sigma-70 family)